MADGMFDKRLTGLNMSCENHVGSTNELTQELNRNVKGLSQGLDKEASGRAEQFQKILADIHQIKERAAFECAERTNADAQLSYAIKEIGDVIQTRIAYC